MYNFSCCVQVTKCKKFYIMTPLNVPKSLKLLDCSYGNKPVCSCTHTISHDLVIHDYS